MMKAAPHPELPEDLGGGAVAGHQPRTPDEPRRCALGSSMGRSVPAWPWSSRVRHVDPDRTDEIVPPGASFNGDNIRYVPPAQEDMRFGH